MMAGLRTEREKLMLGFHAGTKDFSFLESTQTVSGVPSLVLNWWRCIKVNADLQLLLKLKYVEQYLHSIGMYRDKFMV
jgi:hypothetical protein